MSNTFVKLEHLKPYIDLAETCLVDVHTMICTGNFKSVHNVPSHTIKRMAQSFEF